MSRAVQSRFSWSLLLLASLGPAGAFADNHVAVVGKATNDYLAQRSVDGKPRRETYVFMPGERFDGATRDRTFETTTFRQIAETLAPELTKQNYWPTPDVKDADLVLLVHWGVTQPRASLNDLTARVTLGPDLSKTSEFFSDSQALADVEGAIGPMVNLNALEQRMYQLEDIADQDANVMTGSGAARLLGYTDTLRKLGESARFTAEEYTLQSDLRSERYFIIVRAYNLHAPTKRERSRPVWTMHLNISSPGNNFRTAMASMSAAGAAHFGRNTDGVVTRRPDVPVGNVKIHDLIIIGEAK